MSSLATMSASTFGALAVDYEGNLWIAEPGGDAYAYTATVPGTPPRARTDRRKDRRRGTKCARSSLPARATCSSPATSTTTLDPLGNVLSQLGTALGFLLVPMASLDARRKGPREIFARLGVRAFRPSA